MGTKNASLEILPRTLDLLILKALNRGPLHGYSIMQALRAHSDDVLQVGESSLYPALQRLLLNGWVKAEWGVTAENRRARYYRLTPGGRKRLTEEQSKWDAFARAVGLVLRPAKEQES